jgi:hypothetical protein
MPVIQKCIYPHDSILKDYMALACTVSEAADCLIIGSALPICAAIMARNVWFPWLTHRLYTNLFSILCAKPGFRKDSTIDLAEELARKCLPEAAFIPNDFSPESLFDEYDVNCGGQPDKLLLFHDANIILTDWQSAGIGPRNAVRFLKLYDCKGFSETYRRNQQKNQPGSSRRRIPETSTSLLFGATFNVAKFQNQAVQAGLLRRFLYYVAEELARDIDCPYATIPQALIDQFCRLGQLSGPFKFKPEAQAVFKDFQTKNRDMLKKTDPLDEALLSRLATAPTHVLKVAMIFEACRSVKQGSDKLELEAVTLESAIKHVAESDKGVVLLDTIVERPATNNEAEVTLAVIRVESDHLARNGEIVLSRSELTRRFANHGRRGDKTVDHLYGQIISHLIQMGQAVTLPKAGRLEQYVFFTEK